MTFDAFGNLFKRNLQDNLRIFMTFSPLCEKLREYVRTYPLLLTVLQVLCFTDWPETALKEVVNKFIEIENIIIQTDDDDDPKKKVKKGKEEEEKKEEKKEEVKEEEKKGEGGEEGNKELNVDEEEKEKRISILLSISDVFAQMHLGVSNNVIEMMKREMKRETYFISQNFIILIKTFNKFLKEKVKLINLNIDKYRSGIQKIQVGKLMIEKMKDELEERGKEEAIKNKENEKLLEEIQEKQKKATVKMM